jgi:hypothetical protein
MSAAISQPLPLFHEGVAFWNSLLNECRTRVQRINGLFGEQLTLDEDPYAVSIRKESVPSTQVRVALSFENWGPICSATVAGQENETRRFPRITTEAPLAQEADGSVVLIFDEGRSFSTAEFARYLLQHFRRCFPGVALPS